MKKRLKKLRQEMQEQGLDALLIRSGPNRFYLSGFTGSAGALLITGEEALFITDFRYTQQAREQSPHFQVVQFEVKLLDTLAEIIGERKIEKIGFESMHETYHEVKENLKPKLPDVEWLPAKELVENLRLYKDEEELEKIKAAVDLTDGALEHIYSFIEPGLTEEEVALELELFMRRRGASGTAFSFIVASGHRGALPHGVAGPKKIQAGEALVIDMGARLNGYVSDLTRTVAVGPVSQKTRDIYNIVLRAQLTALENIKPGMTGKEADELARRVIEEAGYKDYFGHGLGHGLGIEVHEAPRLSPLGENVLEPGMVFSVEPGIYLPDEFGVRIEDVVVLEEDGVRILTGASKEFKEV